MSSKASIQRVQEIRKFYKQIFMIVKSNNPLYGNILYCNDMQGGERQENTDGYWPNGLTSLAPARGDAAFGSASSKGSCVTINCE
jgi:hypothetical protein